MTIAQQQSLTPCITFSVDKFGWRAIIRFPDSTPTIYTRSGKNTETVALADSAVQSWIDRKLSSAKPTS